MRTLRADFVDAAADGSSEIKLSGIDSSAFISNRRPASGRACRIEGGQKLIMPQPRADRG